MVLAVSVASSVSNDLESANDLSNSEETEDFCDDNAGTDKLLVVHVANTVQELGGVHRVGGGRGLLGKSAWVSERLDGGLVV